MMNIEKFENCVITPNRKDVCLAAHIAVEGFSHGGSLFTWFHSLRSTSAKSNRRSTAIRNPPRMMYERTPRLTCSKKKLYKRKEIFHTALQESGHKSKLQLNRTIRKRHVIENATAKSFGFALETARAKSILKDDFQHF